MFENMLKGVDMDITRRRLLKWGVLGAGAATVTGNAEISAASTARRTTPSIVQGATDDKSTQFSIVHPVNTSYLFKAEDLFGNRHSPAHVERLEMAGQRTSISKVYFSNLDPKGRYTLTLFDSLTGVVADVREFKLLDLSKESLSFAICSCMDEFRHSPGIWQDLVAREPDVILFAGDSTYCDYGDSGEPSPARMWRRFSEARATLEIYFSRKLIPILATWDDHDFGLNDTGMNYPFVFESQKNFLSFFAMNPEFCSVLERGPGISSAVRLNGQQFLLMDDRSFRIAGFSRERYAHWGREQEEWMLEKVAGFEGLSWIVNGSQIFPQMIFKESFSGDHPVQFEAFKSALSNMAKRVALISGDVHYSEVSRIEPAAFGYETFELTSSSIHSEKFRGLPGLSNHARRIVAAGERNYLLVDCRPKGLGGQLKVDSCSASGVLNFSLDLEIR